MPLVFIHGVNVRDDPGYFYDLAARSALLKRLLLDPLAAKGDCWASIEIANPYWGRHGAQFRWNHDTLPKVESFVEYLGGENEQALPESDYEMARVLGAAGAVGRSDGGEIEVLGSEEGILQRAALADLGRFLESVLAPISTSEDSLAVADGAAPEQVGVREALLLEAADEAARDVDVQDAVASAAGDEQVVDILESAVLERFERLVRSEPSAGLAAAPVSDGEDEHETLGAIEDSAADLADRAAEFFSRVRDAPRRVLSTAAIELFRAHAHSKITRFVGDVFVYLLHRGDRERPGPIVATVLEALKTAPRHHADEPLIVFTHSMGGNIFYDILTYFEPDLHVDAWISVGGQVGQFEEMKLFKASDAALGKPAKVRGLKPRVKYWLNVYDPVDLFGFLAQPVFADVDEDLRFLTGAGDVRSHGAYFLRPRFYREVSSRLERALA